MDRGGDVGVDLDVDAWVVRVGAECLRGLHSDAIQLEVGDRDGDHMDGGADPRRESAGRRQRSLREVGPVEGHQDGPEHGLGALPRRRTGGPTARARSVGRGCGAGHVSRPRALAVRPG